MYHCLFFSWTFVQALYTIIVSCDLSFFLYLNPSYSMQLSQMFSMFTWCWYLLFVVINLWCGYLQAKLSPCCFSKWVLCFKPFDFACTCKAKLKLTKELNVKLKKWALWCWTLFLKNYNQWKNTTRANLGTFAQVLLYTPLKMCCI